MTTRSILDRTFAGIVFDWDGTAVPDRRWPALDLRRRVQSLIERGVHLAVVSGTNVRNVDAQLGVRPDGPGRLLLAVDRGSELYEVGSAGPRLLRARHATEREEVLLDAVAERIVAELADRGLDGVGLVARRNRRKIDLMPLGCWADPPKARIAELLVAVTDRLHSRGVGGLAEVVQMAQAAAADVGLACGRVTTDAKHVEIGLTDKSDAVRQVAEAFEHEGISAGLVLLAGDEFGPLGGVDGSDARMLVAEMRRATKVSVGVEPGGVPAGIAHLPGGPRRFLELLEEQGQRRTERRVPEIDADPEWCLVEDGPDPVRRRVVESIFAQCSGGFGARASTEEAQEGECPGVIAAGCYTGDAYDDGLAVAPHWARVPVSPPPGPDRRILDLRTGMLERRERAALPGYEFRSLRFADARRPGVLVARMEAGATRLHLGDRTTWQVADTRGGGGVGLLVRSASHSDGDRATLDRTAAVVASRTVPPTETTARTKLQHAVGAGFDELVREQRATWARRWDAVDIRLPADVELQRGLRFCLYQLWNLQGGAHDLAVGARGLTGPGYRGHVFWDADVFVLPALVTVSPKTATALIGYRLNRLAAARRRAAAEQRAGARFPWESAATGYDVTPSRGFVGNEPVMIRTGQMEEHITACVAWSVVRNAIWQRPGGVLTSAEGELLAETARYWATRISVDTDGSGHIRGVIGPDEYHENVDDDAFTNVMARWNLRTAARVAGASAREGNEWVSLAARLVDGYSAASGVHEQFRGYRDLADIALPGLGTTPIAADVLLGTGRLAGSRVIKQPDVLMLHHLVPDEMQADSLAADCGFYVPRTAHGSSLSPAISAAVLARAGRCQEALDLLRVSLSIDLDDVGGTTGAGVHLGACAGAWQAVLFGFLGARMEAGGLVLDPHLPDGWEDLEVRFRCLGGRVRVRVAGGSVYAEASRGLSVRTPGGQAVPSLGRHRRGARR